MLFKGVTRFTSGRNKKHTFVVVINMQYVCMNLCSEFVFLPSCDAKQPSSVFSLSEFENRVPK